MSKKKYKNLGGRHQLPSGKIVEKGGTFASDDADLMRKFPNKFELITRAPARTEATTEDEDGGEDPVAAAAKKGAEGLEPKGPVDVTAEFPTAEENDLTVVKDGGAFFVYDGDEDPANEEGLKKKDVEPFIESYLE